MLRRGFLKKIGATSMFYIGSGGVSISSSANKISDSLKGYKELGIPPIYCTAYIDPRIESQKHQESIISKFPMAIVPQNDHEMDIAWRNRIKEKNPDIIFLGYQVVIEETTVPGPGHLNMRKAKDPWVRFPGVVDYFPTVSVGKNKIRRIFDPRKKEWQERFIESCLLVLESYPFEGLFLDQCTIFSKASRNNEDRNEMLEALDMTLKKLREIVPKKLIIGNSAFSFSALNGEMNEAMPKTLQKEINQVNTPPRINLYQTILTKNSELTEKDRNRILKALELGYMISISKSYQRVSWFDIYDQILKNYAEDKSYHSVGAGL